MGPINFIKRVLNNIEHNKKIYGVGGVGEPHFLGGYDEIFDEVFHVRTLDSSFRFAFHWKMDWEMVDNFGFIRSKESYTLQYALRQFPGLEQELKLLECVHPLPENRLLLCGKEKSMGGQFYLMSKRITVRNWSVEIDSSIFQEFNRDNLPLSHLRKSIALYVYWHNFRVDRHRCGIKKAFERDAISKARVLN